MFDLLEILGGLLDDGVGDGLLDLIFEGGARLVEVIWDAAKSTQDPRNPPGGA